MSSLKRDGMLLHTSAVQRQLETAGKSFGLSRATDQRESCCHMLLHRSSTFEVHYQDGGSACAVISFAPMNFYANGTRFWGQELFAKMGVTGVGLVATGPNWYSEREVLQAAPAINDALAHAKVRCTFGVSMGGYAALKYSRALGAEIALAFAPQFSINPLDLARQDTRFVRYFDPALHNDMAIRGEDICPRPIVFFDPGEAADAVNVGLIQRIAGCLEVVCVYSSAHFPLRVIAGTRPFSTVLQACMEGNIEAVRRLVSERRKNSVVRIATIAERAAKRRPAVSMALLDRYGDKFSATDIALVCGAVAEARDRTGDLRGAAEVLTRSLKAVPDRVATLQQMSKLQLQLGGYEEAIAYAKRAVQQQPDDPYLHVALAETLNVAGQSDAALAVLLEAIPLCTAPAPILRRLRDTYTADKAFDRATDWARRTVVANPFDAHAHWALAGLLLQHGEVEEALRAARQAVRLSPRHISFLWRLSDVFQRSGDHDSARDWAVQAIAAAPEDAESHARLATLLLSMGDVVSAKMAAQVATRLAPNNPNHLRRLAEAEVHAGNLRDAATRAQQALALDDQDATCMHF